MVKLFIIKINHYIRESLPLREDITVTLNLTDLKSAT